MSVHLSLEHFGVRHKATSLVRGVNAGIHAGEIIGVVGPNGAGKSSLLKALAGLLLYEGTALLNQQPLKHLTGRERSQAMAYVEQFPSVVWPLTVREVVALGRIPFTASRHRFSEEDTQLIAAALRATDCEALQARQANTLSGGEFARVMLARALATDAPLLLLDEPLSGLDMRYQLEIIRCLKDAASQGKTVVLSLHDVNVAAALCHKVILLSQAEHLGFAPLAELLEQGTLEAAFGVRLRTLQHDGQTLIYTI